MIYECIESKRDGGWAVEAINEQGEISRVLFMGVGDEQRAREYADWKNATPQAALSQEQPRQPALQQPEAVQPVAWQPIETAPKDFQVVLTMHAEDLYPVAAYFDGTSWRREVEGPEDIVDYPGKHDILFRWPTHWQPLPAPPAAAQGGQPGDGA